MLEVDTGIRKFPRPKKKVYDNLCYACGLEPTKRYLNNPTEFILCYNCNNRIIDREKVLTYKKKYYKDNKDSILSDRKIYYENNKDEISTQHREYRKNNKDEILTYKKGYYEDNKDEISTQKKGYYKDNRKKVLTHQKVYYRDNKKKILIYQKIYRENNKNKILIYKEDNKKKVSLDKKNRKQMVFQILDNKCAYENQYCNGPLEREHKIPRKTRQDAYFFDKEVLGGKIEDKQLACRHHNKMKNDCTHKQFMIECKQIVINDIEKLTIQGAKANFMTGTFHTTLESSVTIV
jgi:hypothetical protein